MINLLIAIAIICALVYYKITNSKVALILYGIYAVLVICITSLILA